MVRNWCWTSLFKIFYWKTESVVELWELSQVIKSKSSSGKSSNLHHVLTVASVFSYFPVGLMSDVKQLLKKFCLRLVSPQNICPNVFECLKILFIFMFLLKRRVFAFLSNFHLWPVPFLPGLFLNAGSWTQTLTEAGEVLNAPDVWGFYVCYLCDLLGEYLMDSWNIFFWAGRCWETSPLLHLQMNALAAVVTALEPPVMTLSLVRSCVLCIRRCWFLLPFIYFLLCGRLSKVITWFLHQPDLVLTS